MAGPGNNEGFRVLEEFVCEATPAPQVPLNAPAGRGVNEGAHVTSELVARGSESPLAQERQAELQRLSTPALLTLVQLDRSKLTPQELYFIHDIAVERLTPGESLLRADAFLNFTRDADELCRAVMQEAVCRIA